MLCSKLGYNTCHSEQEAYNLSTNNIEDIEPAESACAINVFQAW